MIRRIFTISLLLLWLLTTSIIYATPSVGDMDTSKQKSRGNSDDIPVNQWVGKKFIFLENEFCQQSDKYELMILSYPPDLSKRNPDYKSFVGKIVTVTKVGPKTIGGQECIDLEEDSTKTKMYTYLFESVISCMMPADEIEKARTDWVGKTIFSKQRFLSTQNPQTGKIDLFPIKYGEALQVNDVRWGTDTYEPIQLIVTTNDGKTGFLSTKHNWTNVPTSQRSKKRPWEKRFYLSDPKDIYKYDDATWALIEKGEIRIGMTHRQVALSWGAPKFIRKKMRSGIVISEECDYGSNQYVIFKEGLVSEWQM